MAGIAKQRDGLYGFDGGSGCAVAIGRGDGLKVKPAVKMEKWAGSRWGSCWLDLAARGVEPDVAAERIKKIKGKDGKDKDALEVECIRMHKDGSKKGEVHRYIEGSLEWDIAWQTLADVPADGVIEFDASQPAGLQWHHQPALTQEEIDGGHFRPENVVNSYAVYGPITGRYLRSDGTEIENRETGKLAHVYRPVLIDADGARAWGTQLYVAGVLRIALPLAWLADAKFPVTLDPTMGYTSIGASAGGSSATDTNAHGPYSPATNGTLDSVSFYRKASLAADTIGSASGTLGVWNDSAGTPGTLLVDSAGGTFTESNAWFTQNMDATPAIASGTNYWLGQNNDTGTIGHPYDTVAGINRKYVSIAYSHGALPSPYPGGSSTLTDYKYSIYATYTEAAFKPYWIPQRTRMIGATL